MDKNIVVVGLGYVGLTLAVTLAEIGFNVTGIEKNSRTLRYLKRGKAHFFEPNLDIKFSKLVKSKKICVLDKITKVNNFNIFIISVGTPLKNKKPDLKVIKLATKEVRESMNENSMIIFRSTVPLGTTDQILAKILFKSNKKFDLCFCPERTAQGSALTELRKMPQVIGGINKKSAQRAKKLFKNVTPNVVVVRNILTAELTKLIDNSQRDVFFAYANEIAEICNDYDISANEVLKSAAINYPRTQLLLPGPVGGPCLTKDSHLLLSNVARNKNNFSIIKSARNINESVYKSFFDYIKKNYKNAVNNGKLNICFLGIAFKGNPITDDIRGSIIHDFVREFKKMKIASINAYDNNVKKKEFDLLKINRITSLQKSFKNSDFVIILNNNSNFKKMKISSLSKLMRSNSLIYDYWGNFDNSVLNLKDKVTYVSYGGHQLN